MGIQGSLEVLVAGVMESSQLVKQPARLSGRVEVKAMLQNKSENLFLTTSYTVSTHCQSKRGRQWHVGSIYGMGSSSAHECNKMVYYLYST